MALQFASLQGKAKDQDKGYSKHPVSPMRNAVKYPDDGVCDKVLLEKQTITDSIFTLIMDLVIISAVTRDVMYMMMNQMPMHYQLAYSILMETHREWH